MFNIYIVVFQKHLQHNYILKKQIKHVNGCLRYRKKTFFSGYIFKICIVKMHLDNNWLKRG